jgi:GlpG protein
MTQPTAGPPQNWPQGANRRPAWLAQIGPVTAVLIGISVAVALVTNFGGNIGIARYLLISEFIGTRGGPLFTEVLHGQVWRLITPIFLHLGVIHLLFNMMWTKDLGTLIERRFGMRTLQAMVVVIGLLSNIGQYLLSGPLFGGMSGVVYGLFGFVWIKGQIDPSAGFRVPNKTLAIMLGWLVLCMTGALGHVANTAHVVGLGAGAAWGFVSAKLRSLRA